MTTLLEYLTILFGSIHLISSTQGISQPHLQTLLYIMLSTKSGSMAFLCNNSYYNACTLKYLTKFLALLVKDIA